MERSTVDTSHWEAAARLPAPPSSPADLPAAADVVIVGGGFLGHWLAYFLTLAEPAPSVLVLERDELSLGASTRNAGFLSVGNVTEWAMEIRHQGLDEALHNLSARRQGQRIVLEHLGRELTTEPCGSADFDPITAETEAAAEQLNAHCAHHHLGIRFEQRTLELGGRRHRAWWNPADHALDPVEVLLTLRRKAGSRGARFATGCLVTAMGDGRVEVAAGVAGAGGAESAAATGRRQVRYRHGYLCTNAFARQLHPASPVLPARGQILVTAPCRPPTSPVLGFLNEGHDYFRPVGGRLLVGGGRHLRPEVETTDELVVTAEIQAHLEALARRLNGGAAVTVERRWAGVMGLPSGSHGSIRRLEEPPMVDDRTEDLTGLGGWGVTLTPHLARRRADALA